MVEPLGVLGHDQQGRIGRDVAQQVENGQRNPESFGSGFLAEAEGRVERGALHGRQACSAQTHRAKQLMQARESQMSLGLHSGRAQHREVAFACERGRLCKQPRLADPRLTPQDNCAAAVSDSTEQRRQQLDFGFPTEQRRKVDRRSGHEGTILAAPSGPVKRRGH